MSLVSTIKATVDSTMLTEVYYAETPKVEDYVDENGVRTTVEYIINDEGKKVKVSYRASPGVHDLLRSPLIV